MPMPLPDLTEAQLLALVHRRGVEDPFVDFKRAHPAAGVSREERDRTLGDRMKDILAFANSRRGGPAYILVGVTNDTRQIVGIDAPWDDATLQDAFRGKANRAPVFRYYEVVLGDGAGPRVGVFEIHPDQPRPLYLCERCGGTPEHMIFVRRGSTNASLEPDRWDEVIDALAPPPLAAANAVAPGGDVGRLVERWRGLFASHGVLQHQIPALLPGHRIPLHVLADWRQTAALLSSGRLLDDACRLFNVRREWLDGDSDLIYDGLPLSFEVEALLRTLEAWADECGEIAVLGFRDGHRPLHERPQQTCAFMLRGTVHDFGEKPIFRYQPVYSPFWWNYRKGRIIARTAWLAARLAGCQSWGWQLKRQQIERLSDGTVLPDTVLKFPWSKDWHPEDYTFGTGKWPGGSAVAADPAEAEAIAAAPLAAEVTRRALEIGRRRRERRGLAS